MPFNSDNMLYLKLKQLQFEHDTWRRLLGFMMDENNHIKNRHADLLSNSLGNHFSDKLDRFPKKIIQQDEQIRLLHHYLVELEQLLGREIFENGNTPVKVENKLAQLRNNIMLAEIQFGNLQLSFNNYLSENYR